MPTCCDETSEAETAVATRRGKKSVRDVLVTTATIMPLCECIQRELTKRQNFKSRFWLKYIAGNRVPVSLPLFFCNVSPYLPLPLLPRSYALAPASRFFQSGNALTRMYAPCEHIACSTEWRNGHKREEMEVHRKVVCCFYFCSVKSKWIPLRPSNVFSERICKERWDFSGGTKVILYVTKRCDIFTLFNVTFSVTRFPTARTSKKNICLRQSTAIWKTRSWKYNRLEFPLISSYSRCVSFSSTRGAALLSTQQQFYR